MFQKLCFFAFLLIAGTVSSYRNGTEPRQIDIIFSFVRGPNFSSNYLNLNVFPFVKNVVNQFYFPDEVEPGSKNFIRVGLASSWKGDVDGDAAVDYICLDDRTSFDLDQVLNGYFTNTSTDENSIVAALTAAEFSLRSDYCQTNKTSVTTNRILVLLTDIASLNGSNFDTKVNLDELLPKFTYIFGVGLNGTRGNQVATNKQDFIKIVGGNPNHVFSTIEQVNDPSTGLVSQINQLISPIPENCTGIIFMMQYGNFTNRFKDVIYPALESLVQMLNTTGRGFTHETMFTNEYIFYSAEKILDYLNFAAIEGQNNEFVNFENAHYFERLLVYLKSGYYQNYGIVYVGQTNYEPDLPRSLQFALDIASFNYPVYVIDVSTNPIDNQQLFKTLTNNVDGRILKLDNTFSSDDLYDYLETTFLVDVDVIGCDNVPPITPIPLSTVITTSTAFRRTTTTMQGSSTMTTQGSSTNNRLSTIEASTLASTQPGTTCSGIIFIGEFTRLIPNSVKENFIKLAANLSAQVPNTLNFAFAEYGKVLYRPVILQPYRTFDLDLTILLNDYLENHQPAGSLTYLSFPFGNLKNVLIEKAPSKFAVLMMGQLQNVRDPTSSNTLARSIADLGTNVYVLDYTQGNVPFSLWSTLTSDRSDHVINGTTLTFDQIVTSLQPLISDVLNNNC